MLQCCIYTLVLSKHGPPGLISSVVLLCYLSSHGTPVLEEHISWNNFKRSLLWWRSDISHFDVWFGSVGRSILLYTSTASTTDNSILMVEQFYRGWITSEDHFGRRNHSEMCPYFKPERIRPLPLPLPPTSPSHYRDAHIQGGA